MNKIISGLVITAIIGLTFVGFASAKVDRVSGGYGPWDVTGSWVVDFEYQSGHYQHNASLTQTGTNVTGNGGYPTSGPYQYSWHITSGSVIGDAITLTILYDTGATGTIMHMTGTIASDGKISGNWDDNFGGTRTGTWTTTSGAATHELMTYKNHGQYVSSQEDKQEAAHSRIGMPVQSKGHTK